MPRPQSPRPSVAACAVALAAAAAFLQGPRAAPAQTAPATSPAAPPASTAPATPPQTAAPAVAPEPPPQETLVDLPLFPTWPSAPIQNNDQFHPRLKALWDAALARPEAENRLLAINAILDSARRGWPGLDHFTPRLLEIFETPDAHPAVVQAAGRALDQIDARGAADAMLKRNASGDPDLVTITDPALARWRHAAAFDLWRKRLDDPAAHATLVASAIDSLGAARVSAAAPRLLELAADVALPPARRLACARAAAKIAPPDIEATAQAILGGASGRPTPTQATLDRLVAVNLLRPVRSASARQMLARLAADAEPTVAGEALRHLFAIDPRLIEPLAASLSKNPDATVRRIVVDALVANPTPAAIATLTPLLDDPIPSIRYRLRDRFIEWGGRPALAATVLRAADVALASGNNWRGLEQAAQIVGKLDIERLSPRLLTLIDHERAEVRLSALAALRWMAIPQTYPALLAAFEARHKEYLGDAKAPPSPSPKQTAPATPDESVRAKLAADAVMAKVSSRDPEMSQIMLALGEARYKPIEPAVRALLPKAAPNAVPDTTRLVAFCVIGMLLQDDPSDKALVALLDARARDDAELTGEPTSVRQAAAQSLVRMKALDVARKLAKDKADLREFIGYSIDPSTVPTSFPPSPLLRILVTGFLEPVEGPPPPRR